MESAASWNVWWSVLDHVDAPELRPDTKLFSEILNQAGIRQSGPMVQRTPNAQEMRMRITAATSAVNKAAAEDAAERDRRKKRAQHAASSSVGALHAFHSARGAAGAVQPTSTLDDAYVLSHQDVPHTHNDGVSRPRGKVKQPARTLPRPSEFTRVVRGSKVGNHVVPTSKPWQDNWYEANGQNDQAWDIQEGKSINGNIDSYDGAWGMIGLESPSSRNLHLSEQLSEELEMGGPSPCQVSQDRDSMLDHFSGGNRKSVTILDRSCDHNALPDHPPAIMLPARNNDLGGESTLVRPLPRLSSSNILPVFPAVGLSSRNSNDKTLSRKSSISPLPGENSSGPISTPSARHSEVCRPTTVSHAPPRLKATPQSRYKGIQERLAGLKGGSSQAAPEKGLLVSKIGLWAKEHNGMEVKFDKSMAGDGDVKKDCVERFNPVAAIEDALVLLDSFSKATNVKIKHKTRLQLAVEAMTDQRLQRPRKGHEAEDDHMSAMLHRLPDPPAFPASSAWEYCIAAQDAINGVTQLEDAIKDIRGKVKILIEKEGMDRGFGASGAQGQVSHTIENELGSASSTPRGENEEEEVQHSIIERNQAHHSIAVPNLKGVSKSVPQSALINSSIYALQGPSNSSLVNTNTNTARDFSGDIPSPQTRHSVCGSQSVGGRSQSVFLPQTSGVQLNKEIRSHATISDEGDSLWRWLENIMVEVQRAESSHMKVSTLINNGLPSGPLATNPHGSRESRHAAAVNNLVERVKDLKAIENLSDAEALARLQPSGPSVDPNALRAAAISSINPTLMQRVLYFMTSLSSSLGRGSVSASDAGFLMTASLDLLLSETHFLISLLHLTQGPGSPHIKALVAVLKAYEAQSEHIEKLRARAEQLQEHVVESAERAEAAEQRAEMILSQQDKEAAELEEENKSLRWENQKLNRKIAELERQLAERVHLDAE